MGTNWPRALRRAANAIVCLRAIIRPAACVRATAGRQARARYRQLTLEFETRQALS